MRYDITIPDDDPRFDDLAVYIKAVLTRGRKSPVPRILAEYALLGFLLTTGKIAVGGGGGSTSAISLPEDIPDPIALAATQREIAAMLDDFFA